MKSSFVRSLALAVCACAWLPSFVAAQEAGPGGSAEAKVIGDHVLVPVTLSTEAFRKETHLVLDYAATTPLHIYGEIFGAVRFGENEQTLKVLGAEGLRLEVHREGVRPTARGSPESSLLLYLGNRYSSELREIDVAAILGGPVLRRFALGMNLDESHVSFTPADEANAMDARLWAQAFITGLRTTEEGRVLAPVSHGDGRPSLMAFNTAGYHSYINAETATALGHPSGDLPDIHFGARDQRVGLSGMAALFPVDFTDNPRLSPRLAGGSGTEPVDGVPAGDQPGARLPGAGAGARQQLFGSRLCVLLGGGGRGPGETAGLSAREPRGPQRCRGGRGAVRAGAGGQRNGQGADSGFWE